MNERKKNAVFIPLRGGSEGIVGKNLLPLLGKPLFYYALDAVYELAETDIWISTDSKAIASLATAYGKSIYIFNRSVESATHTASTEMALLEFVAAYSTYEHYILVQGTNPFVKQAYIEGGLLTMAKGYDSVLSVVKTEEFFWVERDNAIPLNYKPSERPRRQDKNGNIIYCENGSFYISSRQALLESQCRISGKIGLIEMPAISRLEIDSMEDFYMAEFLMTFGGQYQANQWHPKEYNRYVKNDWETDVRLPEQRKRNNIDREYPFQENHLQIKGVFTDCDGVLTDGGMYYGTDRMEYKKFNARDGHAFQLLREQGILTGIISGEANNILENRAKKLQVSSLLMGISDKVAAISPVLEAKKLDFKDIAYIGDDVNDIALMKKVKISFAPSNAHGKAKMAADIVLQSAGGAGAFRDMVDFILGNV